jgi:phytoene desaturase
MGGLATALRLAHRGHRVTVLEKNDQVGGRNRELKIGEATFDAGPTLMMMLDPFEKLFRDVGERLEDHLKISLCDPNYRVTFGDSTQLDCTANMALMRRNIERLAGPADAAKYPGFIGKLGELYREAMPTFVNRNYDSLLDLARPGSLQTALKHNMLGNLARAVEKTFDDKRLHQLFCLQTMYLGLSPYDAPYVYGVLVYMEYGEGIWYPDGGMVQICRSVANLATKKGAEIRLNPEVTQIEPKAVTLATGERLEADAVICNADLPYAEKKLLKAKKDVKRRYSCSTLNLYIDYQGEIPELLHHNILLGKNFFENLDQIFNKKQVPDDPAMYVAISSKTDKTKAAPGHANLYILIPTANLDHNWTDADEATLTERAYAKLEAETSFRRENIRAVKSTSPRDWNSELNLDKGSAFGLSHDLLQSVCFRPSNRKDVIFYVGASNTPGNWLPMVLIGAELVEDRLKSDGLL